MRERPRLALGKEPTTLPGPPLLPAQVGLPSTIGFRPEFGDISEAFQAAGLTRFFPYKRNTYLPMGLA